MSCQPLIGRPTELARIRALADPERDADRVLLVLGDFGIGKSALLSELTAHAGGRGVRILSAAGRERDYPVPFAGLRALLRPVLVDLLAMPGRGAEELRVALGLTGPDARSGLARPGLARPSLARADLAVAGGALLDVLAMLAGPAEQAGGVLAVVDDAQWFDRASLDVLAFAADRLDAGPAAVVLAARGDVSPGNFGLGFPVLRLGPLSPAEAADLLDAQPKPPRGRLRAQVLAQSAGNPLALIELTRALAANPSAGHGSAGLPLPLTDRLSAEFAARLGPLPAAARDILLLFAVADPPDRDAVARATSRLDPAVFAPAEELGLISVDAAGARFRHPLVRSAVYHGAPFASRAATHRQLAGELDGRPDRRAWHLGAAARQPDEDVASLLAATAAGRTGGAAAQAIALERAADLSTINATRARYLLTAGEAAVSTGQTEWARDLAGRAAALTEDPGVRSRCRYVTGWSHAWSGGHAGAAQILLPLARENAASNPGVAWNALGLAATAAYQAGNPNDIRAVADALGALPRAGSAESRAQRAWALAVAGRGGEAAVLLRRLGRAGASELNPSSRTYAADSLGVGLHQAGAAAWLLDQTQEAIRLLDAARSAFTDPSQRAASGGALAALGWALLDAGEWDDALWLAAETGRDPAADFATASWRLVTATIEAARGETGRARELIAAALAADPEQGRLVTARARHALGLCALADDDYPAAFGHLHRLFDDDGTPYHPHVSGLAVGDLALAAARAGRRSEGREILKRVAAQQATADPDPSPRQRQLLARAGGILADPCTPAAYPDDVLADPEGDRWPFERAQLRLEYGEWLRRRRRISQARPVLAEALDTLRMLGARPWARRAETELRASGIAVPEAMADASVLLALSPQQRHIIELAAQGLSNRAIAQRLFLSHRTVASHLYRAFPKLGVAGRHQLRAVLAQALNTGSGAP